MPRAVSCLFNQAEIGVEEALRLRNRVGREKISRVDFRCIECGEAVKAMKASDYGAAHFEHFERNPECGLSDPQRS